jgi:hypothetical protein
MSTVSVPVSELTGAALDWAVAKCEGYREYNPTNHNYSECWNKAGPIIERQHICIYVRPDFWPDHQRWSARPNTPDGDAELGPTPLIAAMRCYVASKLGSTVDIPAELVI